MLPRIALALSALVSAGTLAQSQTIAPLSENAQASFFWGDFDGDGLDDAFVVTPTSQGRLLKNRGDGTLEDVTVSSGLADLVLPRFAVWEDFDRDGDLDLFVGSIAGPSRLFANESGRSFVDVTESAGLAHEGVALHAGFLDYDRDGLLDLHIRTTEESLLYRNLGRRLFTPVELDVGSELAPTAAIPADPKEGSAASPTGRASVLEKPAAGAPRTPSATAPDSGDDRGPRTARAPSSDRARRSDKPRSHD